VSFGRLLGLAVLVLVVIFGLIQLVPYGRDHTNPPVLQEPAWDGAQTRALAVRACYDCHSNETVWPRYSNIAPASWLVQRDVDEGRRRLNFSEWGTRRQEADEIAEVVREGEMPPFYYLPLHRDARLSSQEKTALVQGLVGTFGRGD
jgi:mono/diheme cytochrome c family protein